MPNSPNQARFPKKGNRNRLALTVSNQLYIRKPGKNQYSKSPYLNRSFCIQNCLTKGKLPDQDARLLISSCACFFSNVFCVCGWPFYDVFFFYRLACS